MKAIIHIGLPKVGSSSIQEFLKINQQALLAQSIRYAPLDPQFGSQFELAATGRLEAGKLIPAPIILSVLNLKTPDEQRAYVQRFLDFLDAGLRDWSEATYVASSEHIQAWFHTRAQVAALDAFLRERFEDVRYVLYLKPQQNIVLSRYSERIRRGETLSLKTHMQGPMTEQDYDAIVTRWENAVGADALDVRLLTPDTLVNGDLIDDFCTVLGVQRSSMASPRRMNTSLSAENIELRRRVNQWLRVRKPDGRQNPWYYRVLNTLSRVWPDHATRLALTDAQRRAIEDRFADSNEALRQRRFPDRETLF